MSANAKKTFFFLFIIVLSGLLQSTVLDYFKILSVKPDLLLINAVWAGLFFSAKWAVGLGVWAGLLKDILCANTFSINTALFPFLSLLTIRLSKKFSMDSGFIRITLVFLAAILYNFAFRTILLFLGNFISWGIFLRVAFLESVYTAAIAPLIFKIVKKCAPE